MVRNLLIISFVGIFFFSCAQNRIEVVKYRDFYKFSDVLKIKSLIFKPFPDNIAFKTKNTLILLKNHKKYSFYSVIYSYKNYCRIFSYTLFGKRVGDIFFIKNKIFFVVGNEKRVYILNSNNSTNSIFILFKDIIKGIVLNNIYVDKECYFGFYKKFLGKVCKNTGFRVLELRYKQIANTIKIINAKNGFPERMIIYYGDKILKVELKKILKPKISPEKSFFTSIQNYKRDYINNLEKFERAIFE